MYNYCLSTQNNIERSDKMHKSSDCLDGVTCSVNTCTYNEAKKCMAEKIHVGPRNAETVDTTDCNTFEPKNSFK